MPKLPMKPKQKNGNGKKPPAKKSDLGTISKAILGKGKPTLPVKVNGEDAAARWQRFLDLEARVAALEARLKVTPAKAAPVKTSKTDDEDDDEDEDDEIDIPGFSQKSNGELVIEPTAIPTWNEAQMLTVAEHLEVDLTPYKGQPREIRRRLYEALEEYPQFKGLSQGLTQDKSAPPRAAAKKGTMPLDVPLGKDDLPKTSPIVGKADADLHLDRDDWQTKGKFLTLHLLAEQFRRDVVGEGLWECEGYNCHDCIEELGNMNRAVYCHKVFEMETPLPKGTAKLTTEEQPEDDEEVWAKGLPKYAAKNEAKK